MLCEGFLFISVVRVKFKFEDFNFLHSIIGKLKAEKKIKMKFSSEFRNPRDIKAHSPSYDHKATRKNDFKKQ